MVDLSIANCDSSPGRVIYPNYVRIQVQRNTLFKSRRGEATWSWLEDDPARLGSMYMEYPRYIYIYT